MSLQMTWILYIENAEDDTRKFLELINEFSKVAGYKIKIEKSVAFYTLTMLFYTLTMRFQKEKLRKQSYLPLHQKEYLGINLPNGVKDLYSENYKKLMKAIEDDPEWMIYCVLEMEESLLFKWQYYLRQYTDSEQSLSKCHFNAIPIKFPRKFFTELEQKKFFFSF